MQVGKSIFMSPPQMGFTWYMGMVVEDSVSQKAKNKNPDTQVLLTGSSSGRDYHSSR